LVKDLEETEAKNDCAGNDQHQFNRPKIILNVPCVWAGSNTSTVAPRVAGGDENGIQCLATLFLGDINTVS
jgi:hypothetical protein